MSLPQALWPLSLYLIIPFLSGPVSKNSHLSPLPLQSIIVMNALYFAFFRVRFWFLIAMFIISWVHHYPATLFQANVSLLGKWQNCIPGNLVPLKLFGASFGQGTVNISDICQPMTHGSCYINTLLSHTLGKKTWGPSFFPSVPVVLHFRCLQW